MYIARTILDEEAEHGGASRTPIHPDSQRGIFWILASFEEPEEGIDWVVLLFSQVVKTPGWQMDITGVAANAFGGLADIVLLSSAFILANAPGGQPNLFPTQLDAIAKLRISHCHTFR